MKIEFTNDSKYSIEIKLIISVIQIDQNYFEATLSCSVIMRHKVKVSNEAHLKYSSGTISKAQLVTKAFLFLLRRETNTAIFKEFIFEEIETSFPEFKNFENMD